MKLEPGLVSGWNELGESYMRKHDWTTAKTCFEVSRRSPSGLMMSLCRELSSTRRTKSH